MILVYIHGACSSGKTFNCIRDAFPDQREIVLEYDSANGFYRNLEEMIDSLDGVDDIVFVAHSLGGIYAVHLAERLKDRVRGAVTLSTPYGGSKIAAFLSWMPHIGHKQLLRDIHPFSGPVIDSRRLRIAHPWVNVVSTKGHTYMMSEVNDGVVTKNSMLCRNDMILVELAADHFEVLTDPESAKIIKDFISMISVNAMHFHESKASPQHSAAYG